jgi:hypothetical protein
VQKRLRVEPLDERVRGKEADQRAGGGAADRVDRGLLPVGVQSACRDGEAGGGTGLIRAERCAAGKGEVEAERGDGVRLPGAR